MAEQLNHKYELLFGQPVSFYNSTVEIESPLAVPNNTQSPQELSTYVDTKFGEGLQLTDYHIEFEISKTKEAGKESKITIYNISDLVLRYLEAKKDDAPILILKAGYQDTDLNLLFQGEIFNVSDEFQGTTRKTTLLLKSGFRSMGEAFTTRSYRRGTQASVIVRDLIADLKLPEGTIYYDELDSIIIEKPVIQNGKTIDILRQLSNFLEANAYFEDGVVNILPKNYVERDGRFVFDINVDNLIGSPTFKSDSTTKQEKQAGNKGSIKIKTTLNGAYQIGNLISLTSRFHTGVYEIESIVHSGSYEGSTWESDLEIKPVGGWEVSR